MVGQGMLIMCGASWARIRLKKEGARSTGAYELFGTLTSFQGVLKLTIN